MILFSYDNNVREKKCPPFLLTSRNNNATIKDQEIFNTNMLVNFKKKLVTPTKRIAGVLLFQFNVEVSILPVLRLLTSLRC